ncbi:hypothetical protein [Helicobacter canis]|uniref:hypothetical protein n=1 Tax=Helicobacter canis TaxID=29419 RepID=UPI000403AF9A|nr:hypothetical protein [Helicobacter canis]
MKYHANNKTPLHNAKAPRLYALMLRRFKLFTKKKKKKTYNRKRAHHLNHPSATLSIRKIYEPTRF